MIYIYYFCFVLFCDEKKVKIATKNKERGVFSVFCYYLQFFLLLLLLLL
jgi:hypothetical protein